MVDQSSIKAFYKHLAILALYTDRLSGECSALNHPGNNNPDDTVRMKDYVERSNRMLIEKKKAFIQETKAIYFRSRGIGIDTGYCFITGNRTELSQNIAAYVNNKAEGEAIVAMFQEQGGDVRLDYREYEPNYVQVKVCISQDEFLPKLQALDLYTAAIGGYICPEIIQIAREA